MAYGDASSRLKLGWARPPELGWTITSPRVRIELESPTCAGVAEGGRGVFKTGIKSIAAQRPAAIASTHPLLSGSAAPGVTDLLALVYRSEYAERSGDWLVAVCDALPMACGRRVPLDFDPPTDDTTPSDLPV